VRQLRVVVPSNYRIRHRGPPVPRNYLSEAVIKRLIPQPAKGADFIPCSVHRRSRRFPYVIACGSCGGLPTRQSGRLVDRVGSPSRGVRLYAVCGVAYTTPMHLLATSVLMLVRTVEGYY